MWFTEKAITNEREVRETSINRFRVFNDRKRSNLLQKYEQKLILFIIPKIPLYISSNQLSVIGLIGSIGVFISFCLAEKLNVIFLLGAPFGLALNWFGDSLDGRIAYYRNKSRKWYGYALDVLCDWFSTFCIVFGFQVYLRSVMDWLPITFLALYGWSIINAQLRYKITDNYTIDSGKLGPTELRIIISLLIISEILIKVSIVYSSCILAILLFIQNIKDTMHLFKLGDERDKAESEYLK